MEYLLNININNNIVINLLFDLVIPATSNLTLDIDKTVLNSSVCFDKLLMFICTSDRLLDKVEVSFLKASYRYRYILN